MSLETKILTELQMLMNFHPVTSDKAATTALISYVAEQFEACNLRIKTGTYNEYPYLLSGTKSLRHSRLLLQAHIDVVPAEFEQFKLTRQAHQVSGRGVYDMLFATAMYLVLIRDLHKTGLLSKLDLDIGIMLTADEEVGGFSGVGRLIQDYACNVCFLPDGGRYESLSIGGRGVLQLAVTAQGTAGHASRPSEFDSPIPKLAAFVLELNQQFATIVSQNASCAITQIHSGIATNQVAATGLVELDIRYPGSDNVDDIIAIVTALADQHGLTVNIIAAEPAYSTNPRQRLVKAFADSYRQVTGQELGFDQELGSSDARFFSANGIPVIMSRPGGGGLHGDKEFLKSADLEPYYTILKEYVMKVATDDN